MAINSTPDQLDLFPAARIPDRFRLDERTVKRGIRHIAEIRKMLAESPRRDHVEVPRPAPRRHHDPRAA